MARKKPKPARKAVPPPKAHWKTKQLPDADAAARLRAAAAPPAVALGGAASCSFAEAVPKTPGQAETENCAAAYKRLFAGPDLPPVVAAMIGLRRGYAAAHRRLLEVVAADAAAPPGLADFVTQFTAFQASVPFDETALVRDFAEVVVPLLADAAGRHLEGEAADREAEAREAAAARAASPVPVGFKVSAAHDSTALTRGQAVVLVGWGPAVRWLLDRACETAHADPAGLGVVRLATRSAGPGGQDARMVRVAPNLWAGCADSALALVKMTSAHVAPTLPTPPDLVVCDDLAAAVTPAFAGRDRAACAGDAQRRLRAYCEASQAAFLAGLPYPDYASPPDFGGPEFDKLRTFTHLCRVTVEDRGDAARLTVGEGAAVVDVPKDQLEADRHALIVP